MRHLGDLELGVATHTGRVRRANEDDFLLCAPQTLEEAAGRGWVLAIADGMGGAAGGAEASRTAVRAAVRPLLDTPGRAAENGASSSEDDPALAAAIARMGAGFRAAVEEVFMTSRENPNLRGMGTTLTILNLVGDRMILGHVGDTRCSRLRDGLFEQLTEDHAVREPDNYLTRCIGAGQREVEADVEVHEVRAGDRVVLMTDGLWAVVPDEEIAAVIGELPPQAAAEELVRRANHNGGPDNTTVILVRVVAPGGAEPNGTATGTAPAALVEVALPAEEVRQPILFESSSGDLLPSRWPWVVLALGLVLLAVGIAKAFAEVDVLSWLF